MRQSLWGHLKNLYTGQYISILGFNIHALLACLTLLGPHSRGLRLKAPYLPSAILAKRHTYQVNLLGIQDMTRPLAHKERHRQ